MATTIRELLVSLGVKADTAAVRGFDGALNAAKRTMTVAAAGAVALTTATVGAAAGAFALAKRTADYIDAQYDASQRAGIAVGAFTELGYSATLAGTSIEALEGILRRGALSLSEAASGSGPAAEAFRTLGVRVKDSTGRLRSQEAVLRDVADGIARTRDTTEQLALVTAIYGRSGAEILPMLREGSKGLREQALRARQLGLVLTDTEAAIAGRFNDSLDDARFAVAGLTRTIGLSLMPTLTGLIERFTDWVASNRDVVKQRLDVWASKLEKALVRVGRVARAVDAIVRNNLGGWVTVLTAAAAAASGFGAVLASAKVFGAISSIVTLVSAAVSGFTALAAVLGLPVWATVAVVLVGIVSTVAVLAEPFIALGVAVGAVILVFDELATTLRGGDSVFRRFLDALGLGETAINSVGELVAGLRALLVELSGAAGDVAAIFREEIDPALKLVGATLDAYLVKPLTAALAALRQVAETTIGAAVVGAIGATQSAAAGTRQARERLAAQRAAVAPRVEAARAATASRTVSVQFGGDTISGVGMSAAEVQAMQERRDQRRRRVALETIAGSET